MSWAVGYDPTWKRDVGYGVPATCDHPECGEPIDRGLSHVCGSEPYGGDHGCGLYFCTGHLACTSNRRGSVLVCARCYQKQEPFQPSPDVPEWVAHKLTDASWQKWRSKYPDEAAQLRATMNKDSTNG